MDGFVLRTWDLAYRPGDQVPPHRHLRGCEGFVVLRGRLEVLVGSARMILGPGEHVMVPAGVTHTFATVDPGGAHVVAVLSPEVDALISRLHQVTTDEERAALWALHHSELVEQPDAIFAHPRLAPIYDTFDGDRGDLEHYLAIMDELGATRVLDVGCGTGTFAVLLARGGRTVIGVDPAAASLAIAERKGAGLPVTWIHGNAGAAESCAADVAVMTGNVAQVFRTDEDWALNLRRIRAALRPGGHLVFETRRPEFRAWEEWAADTELVVRAVPGVGRVGRRLEVIDVHLPYVSFRYTYRFLADGTVLSSDSTLRFRDRAEIETSLTGAGFEVRDVREAPDRPGREFVFIARRTD